MDVKLLIGLAYSSGRGATAVFGLTSERVREQLSSASELQALSHMVWQLVATGRAMTRSDLRAQLSVTPKALTEALDLVLADGRVTERDAELSAEHLHIPVGSELGWEAAVSDHFRAVATSIAAKLEHGRSSESERIGGTTLRFTVHPEHPHEREVYALLESTRERVGKLWQRVSDHNQQVPPPEGAPRVTFYFGQNVQG
jgi:hypothetical protein